MQVAFVTLFLGLLAGPQRVILAAGQSVVAIELRLDGRAAARATAPDWMATVDLGEALLPHHLEAIAVDGAGQTLSRAEQWLNLPRSPAEVELVFARADPSDPGRVRMTWQSVTNEAPSAVELDLDGTMLRLDAAHGAALPPRPEGDVTRILTARVRFPSGLEARRIYALGREFGDAVATDLTAVPVRVLGGGDGPSAAQLGSWLREDERPLAVDGVEKGGERILVVRDPAARKGMRNWSRYDRETARINGAGLQFIWPSSQHWAGSGIAADLFPRSQEFDLGAQGLPYLSDRVLHDGEGQGDVRLADAVAVAGLTAAAEQRPRAVVLLLAAKSGKDASRFSAPAVRRYLKALGVPLFVWLIASDPVDAAAKAWGDSDSVMPGGDLTRAWAKLSADLVAQRIVWVEGSHLPQAIRLSPLASRLELLATLAATGSSR